MREQEPKVRAKNFEEVACGYSLEEALRESERCLMCPDEPCVARLPGRHQHPRLHPEDRRASNLRGAYDILTDTNLLPAICGRVCPQENQCEGVCTVGDSLEPVAIGRLERFVGDTAIARGLGQHPLHRAGALSGSASSARVRPAWPAPPTWPRPAATSRSTRRSTSPAACCKYGIPDFRLPNDGDRRRDRQPRQARRQVRVQHAGRPPVHHRADDRRDGLRRGVHRRRRRLSDDARHPRRLAQRRAVGQRTADALQPDARARFPDLRHAAADRQARRRGRRRQHRDGRDARVAAPRRREGLLHLPPLAAPKRRRAPRKCITPSRKASSSTG